MNDLTPLETVEQPVPPEISEPQKTYAPWVGVVMGWFLPGLPHFLTGRRWTGVTLFFCPIILLCLFVSSLGGSKICFLGGLVFTIIAYLAWLVALLVSSYRPVRHVGWIGWISLLLFSIFVTRYVYLLPALVMKQYCVETFVMSSMSMAPTLQAPSEVVPNAPEKPDRIAVNKMVYRFYEPKRGDIVVYRAISGDGEPTNYVKRIVGLPGETVDIESPYVLIDGKKVTDPPFFETMAEKRNDYSGYFSLQEIGKFDANRDVPLPITLGADEYFVMGDNSRWSRDSRFTGPIKRSDILGKAIRIYWPPDRFGDLK